MQDTSYKLDSCKKQKKDEEEFCRYAILIFKN